MIRYVLQLTFSWYITTARYFHNIFCEHFLGRLWRRRNSPNRQSWGSKFIFAIEKKTHLFLLPSPLNLSDRKRQSTIVRIRLEARSNLRFNNVWLESAEETEPTPSPTWRKTKISLLRLYDNKQLWS